MMFDLILQISRDYNLQVFLHENHVFTDLLQYQFEPQDNDQVCVLAFTLCSGHLYMRPKDDHWTEMPKCKTISFKSNLSGLNPK